MIFLTNMTKEPGLPERVAEASRVSGQDVRYHDHPMPIQDPMDYDDGYDPSHPGIAELASIAFYGAGRDCSEFWRAFEALGEAS